LISDLIYSGFPHFFVPLKKTFSVCSGFFTSVAGEFGLCTAHVVSDRAQTAQTVEDGFFLHLDSINVFSARMFGVSVFFSRLDPMARSSLF
jgi:hypothetical protein